MSIFLMNVPIDKKKDFSNAPWDNMKIRNWLKYGSRLRVRAEIRVRVM